MTGRGFLKDERGNIAVLTSLMAMPIMILVAGVIDTSHHTRVKGIMQTSADAAVIAAFHSSKPGWRRHQRAAHNQFRANVMNTKFPNGVKMKMTREISSNNLIYTYQAKTRLDSLFGNLSPFPSGELKVEAKAKWKIGSNEYPRLIGNEAGQVDGGRP